MVLHPARQASEAPPNDAAGFWLSTPGSELPRLTGDAKGGEETLLSCKVCSILGLKQQQEASPSCHRDTARKATLEEMALVPEQGEFSAVSLLLCFPWGNVVLPRPWPWRSASPAPALPCSLGFVGACKQQWLTRQFQQTGLQLTPAFSATKAFPGIPVIPGQTHSFAPIPIFRYMTFQLLRTFTRTQVFSWRKFPAATGR